MKAPMDIGQTRRQ